MQGLPTHPHATVSPSAVVTLGRLPALKGGSNRAFSRWVTQASRPFLPRVPERTRLWRLCMTQQDGTEACLAAPTGLRGSDTSGIALSHPIRAGRRRRQSGRTGRSHHRWMVGSHGGLLRNQWGVVVAWDGATATGSDTTFQPLLRPCAERLMVLRDTACHAATGEPVNLQLCQHGAWNDRMRLATVLSMLTVLSHCTQVRHRVWEYVPDKSGRWAAQRCTRSMS